MTDMSSAGRGQNPQDKASTARGFMTGNPVLSEEPGSIRAEAEAPLGRRRW